MYSEDGILQSVPQIDPFAHNIPQEEVSAVNKDSARKPLSMVNLPIPEENLLTLLKATLQADNQQVNV